MAKKAKYYVVWKGRETGIFTNWKDCEAQIKGVEGAQYKSFESLDEAEIAIKSNFWKYVAAQNKPTKTSKSTKVGEPVTNSLVVDAAWNTASGDMEYQGIYLPTKQKLFLMGPFAEATNNIGEFLAIVHALAYLQQNKSEIPVYSDSVTAISWVKKKHANTKLALTEANKPVFELVQRAERWLSANQYKNQILKWETTYWGENPADFGRK